MVTLGKIERTQAGWAFILLALVLLSSAGIVHAAVQEAQSRGVVRPPKLVQARRAQPLASRASSPGYHARSYRAVLANGQVVYGSSISDWGHSGRRATLGGVWLFNPANPVSWIRSAAGGTGLPEGPYVEFAGGDLLPCNFRGYRSGKENPASPQLPHLQVQPAVDMWKPGSKGGRQVRILTRWLRRVVFSSRSSPPLSPGTIFYADGSSERFRSMRWGRSGVRLLLDSGVETISFNRIAELHLLPIDPWDAYFEQLALLLPDLSGRLVRVETIDGAVLSTSDARFRVGDVGHQSNPRQWWHVVQPAWSLDALWVKYSTVASRIYSRPEEVSLASFRPLRVREKRMIGGGGRWIEDRSVLGNSLVSGGVESARGFGVRAFCEMEFALSDCVAAFQTRVGIDRRAREGGCASARVLLRDFPSLKETKLYQSEVLLGSGRLFDTGRINLAAARGRQARLVLLADPEMERTPAGADPLDIRDFVDWIEPRLTLDTNGLRREVASRIGMFLPALNGWAQEPARAGSSSLVNHWDEANPQRPGFKLQLQIPAGGMKLSRRMQPSVEHRYLAVCARLLSGYTDNCQLMLLVGGVERTRFVIPAPAENAALPVPPSGLVFDLSGFSGNEVDIELRFVGNTRPMPIEISGLSFTDRRPGLQPIYEDDPHFSSSLTDGDGFTRSEWRDSYSGSSCVLVSGGEKESAMLKGLDAPIRAFPSFGEYRFLRVAWKKKGGGGISLQVAHDNRFGPEPGQSKPSFRLYQGPAGKKPGEGPFDGSFVHLHPSSPADWVVQTVDLFEHFGEFNLTGLGLNCPDGEHALFDHVWLGRTSADFDGSRLVRSYPRKMVSWRRAMSRKVQDPGEAEDGEKTVELVAPGFKLTAGRGLFGEGPVLLRSYRGRPGVLRTHPGSPADAVRLSRKLKGAQGTARRLKLSVGHDYRGDWRLQVLANGKSLVDMLVGPEVSSDGWIDLDLDLAGLEGENIELEVLNKANGWSYEYAYWWLVSVE